MKDKIYYFYTLSSSDEPERVRYVGVTQTSLKIRFQGHKGKARGKNPSQPVHKWMKSKYDRGFDIICKEIDTCSINDWEEKERYWISYYKEKEPELLNLQKGGSGIVTAEMRSIDGMERTRLASIKPVASCDDNWNIIKEFESLTQAAEFYGIQKSNIWAVLAGKKQHCGGFRWKYLEKKIDLSKHIKSTNSDYNKRIIVYKFDVDNNLIQTYQSIRQVIRDIKGDNCTQSGDYFTKNILNCNKLWENFYWSTDENYKIEDNDYICKEVDSNGNIVDKFRFKTHAAKKFNISIDKINYALLKHKALPNGNFIEKY